jgi:ATP-dependent Zn protease
LTILMREAVGSSQRQHVDFEAAADDDDDDGFVNLTGLAHRPHEAAAPDAPTPAAMQTPPGGFDPALVASYRAIRDIAFRPDQAAMVHRLARALAARADVVTALRHAAPFVICCLDQPSEIDLLGIVVRTVILNGIAAQEERRSGGLTGAARRFERENALLLAKPESGRGGRTDLRPRLSIALQQGTPVIMVTDQASLADDITVLADAIVALPALTLDIVADVIALCLTPTTSDPRASGTPGDAPNFVASMPHRLAALDVTHLACDDLLMTVRAGSTPAHAIDLLNRLALQRRPTAAGSSATPPRLEDLAGYGEARQWGLDLARDLAAYRRNALSWADVDRGLLLSGAPGVGKTWFAKALAGTCGVPLVQGSIAAWQADRDGHLGTMLQAMRKTFAEARAAAPAILVLDEIDGIGDRAAFTGDSASYSIQVVNALLELIDGLEQRDGVVVIGACNYPDMIDPALRRAGRLDRHIALTLPGIDDLAAMLRFHLGADAVARLATDASSPAATPDAGSALPSNAAPAPHDSLRPVARRLLGSTPADVARIARDARRRARKADRPLTLSDLMIAAADGRATATLPQRRRVAIHEAAHAVIAEALHLGRVTAVALSADGRSGRTRAELHDPEAPTRPWVLDQATLILAGRAAEEVLLGAPSLGAGGDASSDLAEATRLLIDLAARMGLGPNGRLLWWPSISTASDRALASPDIVADVEQDLRLVYEHGKTLVKQHAAAILALADQLLADLPAADQRGA